MPTYDYKCPKCERTQSVFQSIHDYCRFPIRPLCAEKDHGQMDRMLSVVPAMSGLANALAGDRHYDGQRAVDGTDISSRTKHREYMKRNGLTTVDDFTQTFAEKQRKREEFRQAQHSDRDLRETITKEVMTAVAKTE